MLGALDRSLVFVGRQGTRAVAASVFLGLALPPVSAALKPILPETVFVLLVLAFLRVDVAAVVGHVRRVSRLLVALFWTMAVVPVSAGAMLIAIDLPERAPGLSLGIMLQLAGPPIMSAPAFAYLMRLDGAFSLALLVAAIVLTPLTAPLVADWVLGAAMPLSAGALALRLSALLLGSAAVAWAIRRLAGPDRMARSTTRIDGMATLLLFVFAIAIMDGVAARIVAEPLFMAGLTALAFALSLGIIGLSMLVFARIGGADALVLGLAAGNRNMGLMIAALAAALPDTAWMFVAVSQFPIYLLPQILKPLAGRLTAPRDRPPPPR